MKQQDLSEQMTQIRVAVAGALGCEPRAVSVEVTLAKDHDAYDCVVSRWSAPHASGGRSAETVADFRGAPSAQAALVGVVKSLRAFHRGTIDRAEKALHAFEALAKIGESLA